MPNFDGAPEHDKIERMTKSLYSKRDPTVHYEESRSEMSKPTYSVPGEWAPHSAPPPVSAPKKSSLFKKMLIASLIFFFVSSGIAIFMFLGGWNVVSSQNVDIAVSGPVSVSGGDTLPLDITVTDKNNVPLESADLSIDYPDGTRNADDVTANFTHYHESLGTIDIGKSQHRTIKAILFGEENAVKDIKITVEYRVKGSNTTFSKTTTYSVTLGTPPISVKVDGLTEINSGQAVAFTVTLASNSNALLKNILMVANYPVGFTFTPPITQKDAPTYDENIWNVGTLNPGEKRTIIIKGKLEGQDGENKLFHFNVGTESPDNEKVIQTTFITTNNPVSLKVPFIGVRLALDGDVNNNHVVNRNNDINGQITWTNNLTSRVINAEIDLKVDGVIVDRQSIRANNGGFYRSVDNTLLWNAQGTPALQELAPGAQNSVTFSFRAFGINNPSYAPLTNQDVNVSIDIKANRLSDSNVPEAITSTVTRTLKVASNIAIVPQLIFSTGPFMNTGPVPPRVETPTTYTVTWTVTNASNDVNGGRAVATLPSYVTWLGNVSPATEDVSFNSENSQVVWQLGKVSKLTGIKDPPRQVSFQVRFLPSLSQLDTVPDLMGPVTFSANDTYVNQDLTVTSLPLSASMTSDPSITNEGNGKVTR